MTFAKKIRLNLGESKLRKKIRIAHRQKQACNLKRAKTAGILFDATNPSSFEPIKNLAVLLADLNIQVEVVGFVNDKKVPDAYLLRRSMNFFSKQDLNWIFRPKKDFIEEFIHQPYDILFDLDLKNYFPIKYVASLSQARFKTGLFKENTEYLDFMIDLNGIPTLETLINQLVSYLGELKTTPPVLSV